MRQLATLALVLGTASTAFAGAPGDYDDDDAAYGGPSSAPVAPVAAPAPSYSCPTAAPVDVMARRWAVGLNLGSMSVGPQDAPDEHAEFRISELSIRYRATYHLEVELALTGGRQVLPDDTDGDLAMGGGTLGVRYRFAAASRWNWWLMGGLGQTTIARHDSTKEEREPLAKPHVQFGLGLERRFRAFALSAELRMTSIGDDHETDDTPVAEPAPVPKPDDPNMTLPPPSPASGATSGPHLQGGQFTIGLSYYF